MMSQNSTRGGFRAVLRVVAAVAFALGTGVLSIAGPTPEERDLGPGDTNRRPQLGADPRSFGDYACGKWSN